MKWKLKKVITEVWTFLTSETEPKQNCKSSGEVSVLLKAILLELFKPYYEQGRYLLTCLLWDKMPTDSSVLALEQTWQQQLLLQSKMKTKWFCNNQTSSANHGWEEQGTGKITYRHILYITNTRIIYIYYYIIIIYKKYIIEYLSIRTITEHRPI